MSFIRTVQTMNCSRTLCESVLAGYHLLVEASNTQVKNAIKEGKQIAMQDLVDNIPDEAGGETVREFLTRHPETADYQGIPREELEEYKNGFRTRGSATEPSRDKTMAEQTRDEIAAKVLHFRGGERGYAYLPGIVRIAQEDCLYGSPFQDNETLKKLGSFINILVDEYDLPNDCAGAAPGNPFDRYLNEMTWDEIEAEYGPRIENANREYHNSIQSYLPDAGNIEHAGEYDIIRVRSFDDAQQYRNLDCPDAPMCIASGRAAWDQHSNNGANTIYLCRRRDALDIPPEPGPDAPLDDYGLSAFYVIVDPDGDPVSITPRWNHAQEATDYSISPQLASDLVGLPFSEAFPPDPVELGFGPNGMPANPNGGHQMMAPPPRPRPRPADRPYIHGWHVADEYIPERINTVMRRRRGMGGFNPRMGRGMEGRLGGPDMRGGMPPHRPGLPGPDRFHGGGMLPPPPRGRGW